MSSVLKLALVLALAAGIVLWFYHEREAPQPTETVTLPTSPEVAPPAAEKYPVPEFVREQPSDLVVLPDLRDSDAYFELELTNLFGSGLAELLRKSGSIERVVATIDNLPRAKLAERLRPLDGPPGAFQVNPKDERSFLLNPENAQRYSAYMSLLASASDDDMVDLYRRYYPLLQEAYVDLGYPNGFFNDRLVEVIDHLLATPTLDESPTLVRPHVLYEFEDQTLEALSVGQKLLLRIGADNAAIVKRRLSELRARITELR